ncbi:hypothetical protein [Epilithonimonas xixisoli]|uniref:Uncharacterized protein n=1 Tax=Epilithonimonas xixisoli TaxID=1476462 RepID=A0A4R8I8U9_9FLAO|nr:hypothetical protein [Epilithonimonas xixisoli]TDX86064.1 hypothetical protein B0I22_0165 [Epilithonimonas xixisoli]
MITYREQIIETINNLIEARQIVFEQIINLAMSDELKHLQDAFDEGDVYSFSLKHFENLEDENIQNLVKLCQTNEQTIFSMMNTNGIKDEEVNLNEDN